MTARKRPRPGVIAGYLGGTIDHYPDGTLSTWHELHARRLEVEYHRDIPRDILPSVQRHVETWLWLVPTWCQLIVVLWEGDVRGSAACTARYDYRVAKIHIRPLWPESTERERSKDIAHEVMHIVQDPYHRHVWRVAEFLKDKYPEMETLVEKELRAGLEQANTDLTHAIVQLVDAGVLPTLPPPGPHR